MSFYRSYMTSRANEANFEKVRPFVEQIEAAADAGEYECKLTFKDEQEANTVRTYLLSLGYTATAVNGAHNNIAMAVIWE